jgi:hypothetical protein
VVSTIDQAQSKKSTCLTSGHFQSQTADENTDHWEHLGLLILFDCAAGTCIVSYPKRSNYFGMADFIFKKLRFRMAGCFSMSFADRPCWQQRPAQPVNESGCERNPNLDGSRLEALVADSAFQ